MRTQIAHKHGGQDRWLVSYADFITLLFGFFVVLYAFSKADQKKQMQVTASVDSAFQSLGIVPAQTRKKVNQNAVSPGQPVAMPAIVMDEEMASAARIKEDLERVESELEPSLASQLNAHTVSLHMGREGLIISLREAGFFASGSATPRVDTQPTLRLLAATLGHTGYDLRIEGHTDNIPIHTEEFDSNWELSSARATGIARFFLVSGRIAPDRIAAAGYAEFHPVGSNDTAEGRAENRRVDIVVFPRSRIDLSEKDPSETNQQWKKITDQ
jgi:chemotaxis protein MotB